jgi:hypothetical protein
MIKDSFPVKLLLKPSETFTAIAEGKTGWAWPLALFAASAVSSALLLALVPADFMAAASSDLPAPSGLGFFSYLAAGLPGGLGFAFFFCALLSDFSSLLKTGRLMLRAPLPLAGVAAYALFFIVRLNAHAGGAAGWAVAGGTLCFSVWAALWYRKTWLGLMQAFFAVSLFTILSDLAGGAAALAGSTGAYKVSEYFFAFISVAWLLKAACAMTGLSGARAFSALLPAMLGAAAFAFSLLTLGVIKPEVFQLLLLM